MFAGAARALGRAGLEELLAALQTDESARNSVFADLQRNGITSIAGMHLSRRQIFNFWPEQFSRSASAPDSE